MEQCGLKKMKVLVAGLTNNRGGTEAVINRYALALSEYATFDYLCQEDVDYACTSMPDSNIYVMPVRRNNPLKYYRASGTFFAKKAQEYDIFWMNTNNLANLAPLNFAYRYGIKKRIVHVHSSRFLAKGIGLFQSELHRKAILRKATDLYACSKEAGTFYFGSGLFHVVPNAFDLESFRFSEEKRAAIRKELGVEGRHVIGTVGRLADQKNQKMLIGLMPEILERNPRAVLVLIGEGIMRDELAHKVKELDLEGKVLLPGSRDDVVSALSAFDVFALPSLSEGLGIAAIEAQANGLPCVISDGVPESVVLTKTTQRIALEDRDGWIGALVCDEPRQPFESARKNLREFDISLQIERFRTLFFSGVGGDK